MLTLTRAADLPRSDETPTDRWGPWTLNRHSLTLRHRSPDYDVDLERCTTSAETLDWIIAVAGKPWADAGTVDGLVRALRDVLRPQATLCSFGQEQGPLDVRKCLAKRAAARRRGDG